MYFEQPMERPAAEARGSMRFILAINTLAVVALGLLPNALLTICQRVIR